MTGKEALEKLDNTLCLNNLRQSLKFNIDDEYNIDCKDVDEMVECLEIVEKDLEVLEIIKKREIDIKDIIETTDDYELYQAYCIGKGYADEYICNKEEFNKLKEWLDNERKER